MTPEFELDPADYQLRLLIDRMERDGRSEAAIDRAVRTTSSHEERRLASRDDHGPDQLRAPNSPTRMA